MYTEREYTMLGVKGRMYARHKYADGLHSNQTFKARRDKGKQSLTVEMRFDDTPRNNHETFAITATLRESGLDVSFGCLHEDIAEWFPEFSPLIRWHLFSTDGPMHYVANTVYHADQHAETHAWVYYTAPQSDPLNIGKNGEKLLSYTKRAEAEKAVGQPGYRVEWDAKTIKTRNLDYARSSAVWPEATDAELMQEPEALKAALLARLPALMADFRATMLSIGFEFGEKVTQ